MVSGVECGERHSAEVVDKFETTKFLGTKDDPLTMGKRKGTCKLTSSAKNVAPRELPHASQELCKAATEKSHSNNDVRVFDSTGLEIVEREQKRCRREGK